MRKFTTLLLVFVGCGGSSEPADPATAQQSVQALLPGLVDDTSDAADDATAADAVRGYRDSARAINSSFGALPFMLPFAAEDTVAKRPEDPERPGAAAVRWLNEHVLLAANYEGDGVYLVKGANVCDDGDSECVKDIDAAEIRVRVLKVDGGLDVTVMVGADRVEPVELELRASSIDATVDLAQAKQALAHIAAATGADIQLPSTMSGKIAATLARKGAKHVEISGAVRAAVKIAGSSDDGPYSLDVAARDPLFKLVLDAGARRHTLDVDIGAVALRAPWHLLSPDSKASGDASLDIAKITASLVADGAANQLTATNVAAGITLELSGHTLLGLDLKPFTATIVPRAGGLPRILLSPAFDVTVKLDNVPLANAGDDVADWALDETYTVHAGQEIQPLDGAIRAVKGTIDVAAVGAGARVTVPEGQCLVRDELRSGEQPLIGLLAAGACP
jgi:hypothetical protein